MNIFKHILLFFCLVVFVFPVYADIGDLVDFNINLFGTSTSTNNEPCCSEGGTIETRSAPMMPEGPIFNGPGMKEGAQEAKGALDDNISKSESIKDLIIGWIKFLLPLSALLAVIGIIWSGFLYITAFGDDGQTEKAKKIIFYVVIGIVLMLGAYAIVNTIMRGFF